MCSHASVDEYQSLCVVQSKVVSTTTQASPQPGHEDVHVYVCTDHETSLSQYDKRVRLHLHDWSHSKYDDTDGGGARPW